MKQLLIGILLLPSFSIFANTNSNLKSLEKSGAPTSLQKLASTGGAMVETIIQRYEDKEKGTTCYVAYTELNEGFVSQAAFFNVPSITCLKD